MTKDLEANIVEFNQIRAALRRKINDERDRLLTLLDGYEDSQATAQAVVLDAEKVDSSPIQTPLPPSPPSSPPLPLPQDAQVADVSDNVPIEPRRPLGTQSGEIKQKVFAEMKEWATVNGIVAATGLSPGQVRGVLSSRKNRMEFQVRTHDGAKWYRLKVMKPAVASTAPTAPAAPTEPFPDSPQ